jgi:hypothetical protein
VCLVGNQLFHHEIYYFDCNDLKREDNNNKNKKIRIKFKNQNLKERKNEVMKEKQNLK